MNNDNTKTFPNEIQTINQNFIIPREFKARNIISLLMLNARAKITIMISVIIWSIYNIIYNTYILLLTLRWKINRYLLMVVIWLMPFLWQRHYFIRQHFTIEMRNSSNTIFIVLTTCMMYTLLPTHGVSMYRTHLFTETRFEISCSNDLQC